VEHGNAAVLIGSEPPVAAVHCHEDGGFSVLLYDAPPPSDPEELRRRSHRVCLRCLIDKHPEVGRGLDLARARGGWAERDPDTGEWS
jgi:hypothetical protein